MKLIVYNKDGSVRTTIKEFTFSEILMGESKISATINSPDKIDFAVNDYVVYNNIEYFIFKQPVGVKTARTKDNIGDAMKYSVDFHHPIKIFETINFDDYVSKDDTSQYYTGTSTFYFFNNVKELALRIKANLDRFDATSGLWNIYVDDSVVLEEKQVSVSLMKLSDGLALINSTYGLSYIVRGNSIYIGATGIKMTQTLYYGKGNGLYELSRSYESGSEIITRMKVYGGSRNLPQDYLREEDGKGRYFTQLMLPNFASTGVDYVDASTELINQYGIREGSKIFDDIYPSIEEVIYGGKRIDEIVSVDAIDLDSDYFYINVNDLGFDLNDYWTSETPKVSIKGSNSDGTASYLGGYEFEIIEVIGNKIKLLKNQSDNNTLPDNITTVRSGDRFVFLYIRMPDAYVTNAENKLKTRAEEYFTGEGGDELSYSIKTDSKYVLENDINQYLIAGNEIKIQDEDLNVANYIPIQSLSVKYGSDLLPKYDIKLSNINSVTLKREFERTKAQQRNINTFIENNTISNQVSNNVSIKNIGDVLVWQ